MAPGKPIGIAIYFSSKTTKKDTYVPHSLFQSGYPSLVWICLDWELGLGFEPRLRDRRPQVRVKDGTIPVGNRWKELRHLSPNKPKAKPESSLYVLFKPSPHPKGNSIYIGFPKVMFKTTHQSEKYMGASQNGLFSIWFPFQSTPKGYLGVLGLNPVISASLSGVNPVIGGVYPRWRCPLPNLATNIQVRKQPQNPWVWGGLIWIASGSPLEGWGFPRKKPAGSKPTGGTLFVPSLKQTK